jgi:hypothetical protein
MEYIVFNQDSFFLDEGFGSERGSRDCLMSAKFVSM